MNVLTILQNIWWLIILNLLSISYLIFKIFPYTPIAPRQVEWSDRTPAPGRQLSAVSGRAQAEAVVVLIGWGGGRRWIVAQRVMKASGGAGLASGRNAQ